MAGTPDDDGGVAPVGPRPAFGVHELGVHDFAGGKRGTNGPLRPGAVFRTDALHRCPPGDTGWVADLEIRRVLDLRTDHERESDGVFRHPDVVTVHVPMVDDVDRLRRRSDRADGGPVEDFYLAVAADNSGAVALSVAEVIASAVDGEPVALHGNGERNRTDIVAALVLALAGVDDADIADSGTRSAEAVQEFLTGVRHHYGSVADFLVWAGADRNQLERLPGALSCEERRSS